jgi:hypothetical protein
MTLLSWAWPELATGHGSDGSIQAVIGPYQVSLLFAAPVTAGANPVQLRVRDASDWPVRMDRVTLTAKPVAAAAPHHHRDGMTHSGMHDIGSMKHHTMDHSSQSGMPHDVLSGEQSPMAGHGMGHGKKARPVMLSANTDPTVDTDYVGEIKLASPGSWQLIVDLSLDGQTWNASLPVEVQPTQPPNGIIAGFAAVNILILGIAALTRRLSRSSSREPQTL